ncbi:MAG TPA: hypothetical protein VGN84_12990 [Solirubrobacterales bacterium]|jgi:hypothetical protein|nr:hypothetical protein [Solirubrobacterales bacterium]
MELLQQELDRQAGELTRIGRGLDAAMGPDGRAELHVGRLLQLSQEQLYAEWPKDMPSGWLDERARTIARSGAHKWALLLLAEAFDQALDGHLVGKAKQMLAAAHDATPTAIAAHFVEPAIGESMCAVRKAQKVSGTSLQMFRPREVLELIVEDAEPDPEKGRQAEDWGAQGSLLSSADLLLQRKALEQIPFRFLYRYLCAADDCPGHRQSIVDWEIVALYRKVREQENWRDLIRAKWLDQMCGPDRDTAFIVGNQHQHLDGFLILGVWWPPDRTSSR